MKVSIKDLSVSMEIKTRGIELDVYDKGTHLGDLVITKSKITWCRGRTDTKNGQSLTWKKFIDHMENL